MSRDPLLYLDDILEACRRVREYVRDCTKDQLLEESLRFDAVVRNLEIIGEAARQLPESTLRAIPDQPWKNIIGMRNILAPVYFGIDPDIVWSVATTKIEPLEEAVRACLTEHDEDTHA